MLSLHELRRVKVCAAIVLSLTACDREKRRFDEPPPTGTTASLVTQTVLQPGKPLPKVDAVTPYDNNAFAIGEGNRLYNWMNCVGCHAHGGGAIGPLRGALAVQQDFLAADRAQQRRGAAELQERAACGEKLGQGAGECTASPRGGAPLPGLCRLAPGWRFPRHASRGGRALT